ncbi:vanin-like protein 1 [Condylostylus longicornis]|uniref:vanin-like protein 1 n=1 Tax=Condylostylus longicornis TaxID=2530218 RepID=UPI00244E28DA|nr:vanin-like protein 1 [Condylostylus longicornis]
MGKLNLYLFFSISIYFINIALGSKPEDPTYKVGVVEFNRAKGNDENITLEENIVNVGNLLRNYLFPGTPGEDVDIVIFPESVLNTYKNPVFVPNPDEKKILCDKKENNPELLNTLSCWAIIFRKYIVFNLVEKTECTVESQNELNDDRPCGQDGINRYNTNIVFDRNGAIIARYRKVNPYGETLINTTITPDYSTFDTDFGVKFGTAICFDLLFKTPIQELVEKYGVTDIVFPTYWFSELPFLTANQIQQGWSYGNNVNFLAAGGNAPETGTTGTGIFSGKSGALVSKMYNYVSSEMLISAVPKMGRKDGIKINHQGNVLHAPNIIPNKLKGLKMKRDKSVDEFVSKLIEEEGNTTAELCFEDICCEFDVDVKTFRKQDGYEYYYYRMVAFSGTRTHGNGTKTTKYKTCAIIACTDDKNLESCGKIFSDETKQQNYYSFNKIVIDGKFSDSKDVLFTPNSVEQSFRPLPYRAFNFTVEDNDDGKLVKMELKAESADLLTFGIYVLDYKTSNAKQNLPSIFIFSVTIMILCFLKDSEIV